jgi:hypothetical protein
MKLGAWGCSLTNPSDAYADATKNWVVANYPQYNVSYINQAIGGHWPWSNLVRLNASLLASSKDFILCDIRPTNIGREMQAAEAILRRIFTTNPTARIITPIFPSSVDMVTIAPLDDTAIAANALAAYYGVVLIDYRQAVIDLITAGHAVTEYLSDGVHPTTTGKALCSSLVEAYISDYPGWAFGPENHSTLPSRLYDNGYYETTPIRLTGMQYTSRTGTWADVGPVTSSSEVGATITFTANCKSFGLYNSTGIPATMYADIKVDDGEWQLSQVVDHNGTNYIFSAGLHTITIRVIADNPIQIDEFWAI